MSTHAIMTASDAQRAINLACDAAIMCLFPVLITHLENGEMSPQEAAEHFGNGLRRIRQAHEIATRMTKEITP